MVDSFSIILSHGLMLIAFWRLLRRDDLDQEAPAEAETAQHGFAHQALALRRRKRGKEPVEPPSHA